MKLEVVTGYIVNGDFTTRVNYDYQSPDEDLPKEVIGTDKETQEYIDGEVDREIFRTTDGKLFLNQDTAKKHQKTVSVPELDEVMDLLEKAKILCAKSKAKIPALGTILSVLENVEGDGGEHLMDKYNDSTCW